MSKYLIFGGRSYLGSEFKKYLDKNNIINQAIESNNSENYSYSKILEILHIYEPTKIVDFKFIKVSSNDSDFKNLKEKDIFQPQKNLIQSINESEINLSHLVYISTAGPNLNIYTSLKRKQEKIYKKYLDNNEILSILKLNTVFGPGDINKTRLIPLFFSKILDDRCIELNIHSNKNGNFIFINDAMEEIFNFSENLAFETHVFTIKYKKLIQTVSYITKILFDFDHKVIWNDRELPSLNVIENDKLFDYLYTTTEWYLRRN